MEILKTKSEIEAEIVAKEQAEQEARVKAEAEALAKKQAEQELIKNTAKTNFNIISEKLKKDNEVQVLFDRSDFNEKLSTSVGFGFQDLKEVNRILINKIMSN